MTVQRVGCMHFLFLNICVQLNLFFSRKIYQYLHQIVLFIILNCMPTNTIFHNVVYICALPMSACFAVKMLTYRKVNFRILGNSVRFQLMPINSSEIYIFIRQPSLSARGIPAITKGNRGRPALPDRRLSITQETICDYLAQGGD